jgi:hypothetical protein
MYCARFMGLPAGFCGGSSWDGEDTTRCCSSLVQLSACIKGSGNAKVWVLEKAILTVARGIVLRKESLKRVNSCLCNQSKWAATYAL